MLSEQDIQRLKSILLVDVMRANGYEPVRLPKGDGRVKFLCPFHHETDGSFVVDQHPYGDAMDAGWKCYGGGGSCGKQGYGAIALQAALMGYDHTVTLTDKQMKAVVQRLVDDHGIEIKGVAPTTDEQRTETVSPQECSFDLTPWTAEHLRALGFTAKLATIQEGDELVVRRANVNGNDNPVSGERLEVSESQEPTANSQSSPSLTGEGRGEALYRCSLDRDFWRGRGEAKTAQEWGAILEREFSIYPVDVFITSPVPAKQGGKCSLKVPSRPTYPIFVFTYDWGVKKYEPKSSGQHKWYWSQSEGIATKVYGDRVAVAALNSLTPNPSPVGEGNLSLGEKNITPSLSGEGRGEACSWFNMKDRRHPIVNADDPQKARMKRLVLCSGPRDAMQMWTATDAHVIWLHNEIAGIHDGVVDEWLRALLFRMTQVAVDVYVCYDIDATGTSCSGSIALENANIHWVRLPKINGNVNGNGNSQMFNAQCSMFNGKPYKDVTDFVTHFNQIQKSFAPDLRKANPSEALMRLLKNALTMQFWIDKHTTKKDKDGEKEKNIRYVLSVANLLQFLDAKGIRCSQDERGQRIFYQLSHNNTYRYLEVSRQGNQLESAARTAMLEWIDAHIDEQNDPFKANLVNTIFTGKGLDSRTMNTMPPSPINEHSWGEDFDYFFFQNTAVRVSKDEVRMQNYEGLPYCTNEECIMPGRFSVIPQQWRIIINPKYIEEEKRHREISKQCTTPEMRAAENSRWTQYAALWKYKLVMDKPLELMPMHFRFLYNLGRIFWEKESFGEELTATERQMQDMHFINKAHAIGYAITRHRSRARQQIVHLTDYSVADEKKASGRNGKSAVIDMLGAVRPSSANVAGKSINGNSLTLSILLGDVVAGVHSVVGVDELPDKFQPEELYNAPVSLVCKTLYHQPVTLRGEEVPKLFIASNKPFDRSAGSTKGRIYPCYTSDYYHAATDDGRWLDFAPQDEFLQQYGVQEVANGLPDNLLNELRNLLMACAQFFFQQPTDTILPPTETRSLRRELFAMTKDTPFTDWIVQYFENTPDNPHIGQPIAPQEMAISLLDSEGEPINNDSIERTKKRITKFLKVCLNRMGIVMDPPVVLDQPSYRRHGGRRMKAWLTQLDAAGHPIEKTIMNKYRREVSTGERMPRELSNDYIFVHYFFWNRPGGIPKNPPTKGKEYEDGYVQYAPETDPEEELKE